MFFSIVQVLCKIPETMQQTSSKIVFSSPVNRENQIRFGSSTPSGQAPPPPPPPNPPSTDQTLWYGASLALVLGGGAFIVYYLNGDKDEKPLAVTKNQIVYQKRKQIEYLKRVSLK